jgi:hypothetical protein
MISVVLKLYTIYKIPFMPCGLHTTVFIVLGIQPWLEVKSSDPQQLSTAIAVVYSCFAVDKEFKWKNATPAMPAIRPEIAVEARSCISGPVILIYSWSCINE